MRRLLAAGFGWSLAWWAVAAADNAVPAPPTTGTAPAPPAANGVALGRPEPILADLGPVQPLDAHVRTGAFFPLGGAPRVVRAHAADGFPRPLPVGPAVPLGSAADPVSDFAADDASALTVPPSPIADEAAAGPRLSPPDPTLMPPATDPDYDLGDDLADDLGEYLASRPTRRFWAKAEYLLWWIKDPEYPPLVTTGPAGSNATLADPGTIVLFPRADGRQSYGPFSGARFSLGFWLDPCEESAIEGSYFFLAQRSIKFSATSDRFPVLTRPFFSLNNQAEFGEIVTTPGGAIGAVVIDNPSSLWGADLNYRCNICRDCWSRFDFLIGFRYLQLDEGLRILESTTQLVANGFPAGTRAVALDDFRTRNQFYGAQCGFNWEWERDRWLINVRTTLALGPTHQTVDIDGFQLVTVPGAAPVFFRGGLLALNPNIGRHNRDIFTFVPEIGINVGYHFTDSLIGWVGYNFLWWTNVLRPGDQIDRVIDRNQIPNFGPQVTPAAQFRPTVPFKGTDFWAQGVNFGLEYRY